MKEKLENMPIFVFLLLGIVLAAYIYSGNLSDLEKKQTQISQMGSQNKEKQAGVTKAENSKLEIPNIKMEIDNLSQSLSRASDLIPSSIGFREILESVSSEAKTAGVRLVETKPGEVQPQTYFDALPLNVQFEGSYSQLAYYMYLLSKKKIIFEPQNMQITVKDITDGHTNLSMQGVLLAYKYKETK